MALFRPYDQDAKAADVQPVAPQVVHTGASAKNRPTPTRKEAEAARMAAVHPKLTKKQMRQADQAAERKLQNARNDAMEAQPERVLMRNYVDSRWSPLELMMGLLAVLVVAMLLGSIPIFQSLVIYVTAMLYVFLVVGIISFFIHWQRFKRELADRYPRASTKGLAFAMLSRMMAFRRMRIPKPTIKRGEAY